MDNMKPLPHTHKYLPALRTTLDDQHLQSALYLSRDTTSCQHVNILLYLRPTHYLPSDCMKSLSASTNNFRHFRLSKFAPQHDCTSAYHPLLSGSATTFLQKPAEAADWLLTLVLLEPQLSRIYFVDLIVFVVMESTRINEIFLFKINIIFYLRKDACSFLNN